MKVFDFVGRRCSIKGLLLRSVRQERTNGKHYRKWSLLRCLPQSLLFGRIWDCWCRHAIFEINSFFFKWKLAQISVMKFPEWYRNVQIERTHNRLICVFYSSCYATICSIWRSSICVSLVVIEHCLLLCSTPRDQLPGVVRQSSLKILFGSSSVDRMRVVVTLPFDVKVCPIKESNSCPSI